MAYDESKDKEVKTWKHEKGLYVSLYQYNGGAPKVQIGPGVTRKPTAPKVSAKWAG